MQLLIKNLKKSKKVKENNEEKIIPKGDQKTGIIGEFYAMIYAKHKHIDKPVKLKPTVNPTFDINIGNDEKKIQVKTISNYAKKKKITLKEINFEDIDNSEILLFLIHLDEKFNPINFWEIHCKAKKREKNY